jgi:hypothetical protein
MEIENNVKSPLTGSRRSRDEVDTVDSSKERKLNDTGSQRIELLRLKFFVCSGLPGDSMISSKRPFFIGTQLNKDGEEYISYRAHELDDDVQTPRWKPDMFFDLSQKYRHYSSYSLNMNINILGPIVTLL